MRNRLSSVFLAATLSLFAAAPLVAQPPNDDQFASVFSRLARIVRVVKHVLLHVPTDEISIPKP